VVVFKGPPSWAPETALAGPRNWLATLGQAVGSVVGIAPPNEKDFFKRVIAVGRETVRCCDAGGNVIVDSGIAAPARHLPAVRVHSVRHRLQRCTSGRVDSEQVSRRCFGPVVVPDGQLWVMCVHD